MTEAARWKEWEYDEARQFLEELAKQTGAKFPMSFSLKDKVEYMLSRARSGLS